MEKYGRTRLATNENTAAHGQCMLGNKDFKHTLIIFNTFGFYTATMVT